MIDITEGPIDGAEVLARVRHDGAGGVVLFLGTVRDATGDRPVSGIEYEAHASLARTELAAVVDEAKQQWPDARIAAVHRIGSLVVSDVSVAVAASCPHRAEAFAAARYVIDTLKERVPIWKKEQSPEGDLWVHGDERVPAEGSSPDGAPES